MAQTEKIGNLVATTATTVQIKEEGAEPILLGDLAKNYVPNLKPADKVVYTLVTKDGVKMVTYIRKSGFTTAANAKAAKKTTPTPPSADSIPAATPPEATPSKVTDVTGDKLAAEIKAKADAAAEKKVMKEKQEKDEELLKQAQAEAQAKQPVAAPPATQPDKVTKPAPKAKEPAPLPVAGEVIGCVELGCHLSLGNFSNFDIKVNESNFERALARIESEGTRAIKLFKKLQHMAAED